MVYVILVGPNKNYYKDFLSCSDFCIGQYAIYIFLLPMLAFEQLLEMSENHYCCNKIAYDCQQIHLYALLCVLAD